MKVAKIIDRTLRVLRVLDASEAAEGEDAATAIQALNALCTRWEASGLAMAWVNVASPADDLPAPDEAENAIVYNLALDIAPEYGVRPDEATVEAASRYLMALRRDRMASNLLRSSPALPLSTARYGAGLAW